MIIIGNELYHHGIKGQKWGIRRYQNEDGTYTDEGKIRKRRMDSAFKPGKDGKPSSVEKVARNTHDVLLGVQAFRNAQKNRIKDTKRSERLKAIEKMSDKELQDKITRLQREKQLNDLLYDRESIDYGKSKVDDFLEFAVPIAAIGASAATIMTQIYRMRNGY